jgi:hypothetical protein
MDNLPVVVSFGALLVFLVVFIGFAIASARAAERSSNNHQNTLAEDTACRSGDFMRWVRDSDLDWFAGVPVLFWVGVLLAGYVKNTFFTGWPDLLFLIVYIIGGCVIYCILAACIGGLIALFRRAKAARTVCTHDIRGGETLAKCEHCKTDKQAFENQLKIEAAERARKDEINRRAIELRIREHERLTRARLHKLDYLLGLSPVEFEQVCAELFRATDYEAVVTPPSNDVGVDIRLSKDGKKYVDFARNDKR